jgi:hypothetical protein
VLLVVMAAAFAVGYASGLIRIGPLTTVAQNNSARSESSSLEADIDDAGVEQPPQAIEAPPAEATKTFSATKTSQPASDNNARKPGESSNSEPEPASDRTESKPADPPVDPAQAARFKAELAAARKALGERNTQAAKERIAAAERLATSKEQKELVAAFQTLPKYVDGFWEAMREGLKGLEEAGELTVGSTIVSVVEVSTQRLTIRANGQNRRYALDELPAGIAVAIAKKWFDDRPDNKVYLGAFYFVDPRTDVAVAKRLWEEAASAGVDVKNLLALLPIAM